MKQIILDRMRALGADISRVKGRSLQEDIQSITFNSVLYPKPEDTPWALEQDQEPIYGLSEFIGANQDLIQTDREAFFDKMLKHYFVDTKQGRGQMFWTSKLFTPFQEGTEDYEQWNQDFSDPEVVNLSPIEKISGTQTPTMIQLFYSYGFPDHYYICLEDPNQENPTVFGTDNEEFFCEITYEGNLQEFMHSFLTPEELIGIVDKALGE
ncbi:hypothetical protein ACYSNX_01990 [Myroides sp. LJL115]